MSGEQCFQSVSEQPVSASGHDNDDADFALAPAIGPRREAEFQNQQNAKESSDEEVEVEIGPLLAQHLALAQRVIETETGKRVVAVDEAESPLAWLARRRGRDGRALIEPIQFQAGERLRADFTAAQMMPRMSANWDPAIAANGRAPDGSRLYLAESVIAARQRVGHALTKVGPEFSGLLIDVCCFLKGLEDVERERRWPPRSAKVVLQLALNRLARHYGLDQVARGRARGPVRGWIAGEEEAALP